MNPIPRGCCWAWLVGLAVGIAALGRGAEDNGNAAAEGPAQTRLSLMRAALDDLRTTSPALLSPAALKFDSRPLLRYNDPTRGLLDATVWRLGETGRPTALVTLEIYRSTEAPAMLTYEFVSLVAEALEMKSPRGPSWRPMLGELKMLPLAGAATPAAAPRARLAQFRKIAERFSAHEELEGDSVECRLLPQPIDRYRGAEAGTLDGAVFAFANGTNPELGLVLECTEQAWSYGACRLSSAALVAALDGKEFFTAEAVNSLRAPVSAPYRATQHTIDVPD